MHFRQERITLSGEKISIDIDLSNQKIPGLSRLYLGRHQYVLDGGETIDLQKMVINRLLPVIDTMTAEMDFRSLIDARFIVPSLCELMRGNIDAILTVLNGHKLPKIHGTRHRKAGKKTVPNTPNAVYRQPLGSIFLDTGHLISTGVSKNALFYTNLRILLQHCFQDKDFSIILEDIALCQKALGDEQTLTQIVNSFIPEISYFSKSHVETFEKEDLYQEGVYTLWSCIQHYKGQNFIPFRAYFLRSLRNKKIDLIRGVYADKRRIHIHTTSCHFGDKGESYTDQQVQQVEYRAWEAEHRAWLDDGEGEMREGNMFSFIESGEAKITKARKNTVAKSTINLCCEYLLKSIEHHFTPQKIQAFRYYFRSGQKLIERIIEEKMGKYDEIGVRVFLRHYWKKHISWVDGEMTITSVDKRLQSLFLERVRGYIENDPLILYSLSRPKNSTQESDQ